jgi:hypothetical protein
VKDLFLTEVLDAMVNTFSKKQGQQFSKEKKEGGAHLINVGTTGSEGGGIVTNHSV